MFKDLNVDSLKVFARKLDLPRTLTRKLELTAALDKELRSNLPGIVARLSETECKVLAQAVHGGGEISRESFKAMYGVEMPNLELWTYHRKDPSLLLMMGEGSAGHFVVFEALKESLRRFVPKPPNPAISVLDIIPEIHQPAKNGWREAASRQVRVYESSEIDRCATDAIMALTGCRPGKRTMKIRDYGKMAATFIHLESGKAVRVAKRDSRNESGSDPLPDFANVRDEDLFSVTEVEVPLQPEDMPGKPVRHCRCAQCGETVLDGREIETSGRILCRPCHDKADYYRILNSPAPL